jgi:hypothetical protein
VPEALPDAPPAVPPAEPVALRFLVVSVLAPEPAVPLELLLEPDAPVLPELLRFSSPQPRLASANAAAANTAPIVLIAIWPSWEWLKEVQPQAPCNGRAR